MNFSSHVRGFTLVELMIAISIILVMLSILAGSFFEARQNSRDRQRVSDLTQLKFALTAYGEANGEYPTLNSATEINNGYIRVIEGTVGSYWDEEIVDPRWDGSGTYEYRIVPELECEGDLYYAVVATNMEVDKNSNGATVCPGNAAVSNAFVEIVAGPLAEGSSTNFITDVGSVSEWWNEADNKTWDNVSDLGGAGDGDGDGDGDGTSLGGGGS